MNTCKNVINVGIKPIDCKENRETVENKCLCPDHMYDY